MAKSSIIRVRIDEQTHVVISAKTKSMKMTISEYIRLLIRIDTGDFVIGDDKIVLGLCNNSEFKIEKSKDGLTDEESVLLNRWS